MPTSDWTSREAGNERFRRALHVLAQMEGQEALYALATRFPHMTLEREDLAYVPTLNTRALQQLPVVLDESIMHDIVRKRGTRCLR